MASRYGIDRLKAAGKYADAGALAYAVDVRKVDASTFDRGYGPHFGMRSDRLESIAQFVKGYDDAAARDKRSQIAGKIADQFTADLWDYLGAATMAKVIDANHTESNPSVCHTHDYCDANVVMAGAFTVAMSRPFDFESDADSDLWNAAWSIAKAASFPKGETETTPAVVVTLADARAALADCALEITQIHNRPLTRGEAAALDNARNVVARIDALEES